MEEVKRNIAKAIFEYLKSNPELSDETVTEEKIFKNIKVNKRGLK